MKRFSFAEREWLRWSVKIPESNPRCVRDYDLTMGLLKWQQMYRSGVLMNVEQACFIPNVLRLFNLNESESRFKLSLYDD